MTSGSLTKGLVCKNLLLTALAGMWLFGSTSHADGLIYPPALVINSVYVSGGQNFHFRIYHNALNGICLANFAFVNETDDGAKGKISALEMAYAMNKTVALTLSPIWGGYCQIVEFQVTG